MSPAARLPLIDKWHHYFEIYERHLGPLRGTPLRMLEIGVQNGGSLEMWRHFLGPDAVLFGIDIDAGCGALDGQAGHVRIGSQADPDFLVRVVDEMGGVDVVLDDGSHVMAHIHASFETLFPRLSEGGLYLVEDLHTAYWAQYGGGLRRAGSFIETLKARIDGLHHWYRPGAPPDPFRDRIFALHVYDSLAVVEKRRIPRPRRSARGRAAQVATDPLRKMRDHAS